MPASPLWKVHATAQALLALLLGLGATLRATPVHAGPTPPAGASAAARGAVANASTASADEARSIIPWSALDDESRALIEDVVNHPTVFHRSQSEVFECSPELYLLLLHEPVLTMELWKAVGLSGATLEEVEPDHFRGADGHACKGRWKFVYKSPELTVIYSEGEYRGPLLAATLETKSVLVLRTVFIEERDNKKYVKHQLDGYVRAESGSLKPAAKIFRPVFQKSVEATMQEVLWFVSLMCRYAVYDPQAISMAMEHAENVPDSVRKSMQKALAPLLAATPRRKEEIAGE